jgi:hypothetical protein
MLMLISAAMAVAPRHCEANGLNCSDDKSVWSNHVHTPDINHALKGVVVASSYVSQKRYFQKTQ